MSALAFLAKEDPLGYFAEPVDVSLVPGYRDVVSCCCALVFGGSHVQYFMFALRYSRLLGMSYALLGGKVQPVKHDRSLGCSRRGLWV